MNSTNYQSETIDTSMMVKTGYLEVYYGPMYSGKTRKLNNRLSEMTDLGYNSCYLNSSLDERCLENSCCSSNSHTSLVNMKGLLKNNIDSYKVDSLSDFEYLKKYNVIGIDEAHFFTDLLKFTRKCLKMNKIIIVAGLSSNYKMEKFGEILDLIPLSDVSENLHSFCKLCLIKSNPFKSQASFTLKLTNNSSLKDIGGNEKYQPVCRYHYQKLSCMEEKDRKRYFSN